MKVDAEKSRQYVREYRARDPERTKAQGRKSARKWRRLHPKKNRACARAWYASNKDGLNAARRAKRIANPEPMRASCRRAAKKRIALDRVERRARYHSDRQFKLMLNLRSRVRSALKARGASKSAHTKELLGCPVVWLEAWIESLFKPGMTWKNHGKVWHIDHIKPCSKFDLTESEQQKICFHWTNHQPLFVRENLSKGDKF